MTDEKGVWRPDPWYQQTERLIAQYWRQTDRLKRLKKLQEALQDSIETLNDELCLLQRLPAFASQHGIKPYTSSVKSQSDYAEKLAQNEETIKRVLANLIMKRKRLVSIEHRIMEIKEFLAPIEEVMLRLSDDEYTLTEQRYIYRRSNYQIGDILHCSEFSVRKMKNRIVHLTADLLGIKK